MPDKELLEKLLKLEKKNSYRAGFRKGLVVGIFIPILLLSVISITLIFSRSWIEMKVGELVFTKMTTQVFSAFPDAYFTINRERIIDIFDAFTNAASKNQIDHAEFNQLGHQFLSALRDRQLTYAELDQILATMQAAAQ